MVSDAAKLSSWVSLYLALRVLHFHRQDPEVLERESE